MLLDTSTGISDQTTAGEGTLVPQAKVCLDKTKSIHVSLV